MGDQTIWMILAVAYVLTWLLIPWVLLKRTLHASTAVAWIMAIIFVPFLGALACGIFGATRWEQRAERKQEASEQIRQQVSARVNMCLASPEDLHEWRDISHLLSELTSMQTVAGNDVQLLPDTEKSLQVMEETIEEAAKWVNVEFYIWRPDGAGTRMRDLLIRKAKAGLQVRFLYDGIGSVRLSRQFLRPLKDAGVQVAAFTPGLTLWHMLTLNQRNHRKIVVTDQQAAFTGGMNIGDEYIHRTESYGHWRDTQAWLRGPVTLQLQQIFAEDWFYATGEELSGPEFYPEPRRQGSVPAQVVADGPDSCEYTYHMLAVAVLGQARDRVTLTTPYFVPPEGLAISLATAARRGVNVRLMISERGNFTWTLQAGRACYDELLTAGVEIYEYERGLYHAKTMTVDGQWALVGTPNWDFRSIFLNFEVAVAMFDAGMAEELERHFEHDRQHARRIDPQQWRCRSRRTRLKEQFWRLFAPGL